MQPDAIAGQLLWANMRKLASLDRSGMWGVIPVAELSPLSRSGQSRNRDELPEPVPGSPDPGILCLKREVVSSICDDRRVQAAARSFPGIAVLFQWDLLLCNPHSTSGYSHEPQTRRSWRLQYFSLDNSRAAKSAATAAMSELCEGHSRTASIVIHNPGGGTGPDSELNAMCGKGWDGVQLYHGQRRVSLIRAGTTTATTTTPLSALACI